MIALTIKDLRRERSLAPGGANYHDLLRTFIPLVYGSAAALVPEDNVSAERIVVAVFRSFALRWRRLPKREFVATWLFRTTGFAVRSERRRLKFPQLNGAGKEPAFHALCQELNGWTSARLDPLILRCVLHTPTDIACAALRIKQLRLTLLEEHLLARLQKRLRRRLLNTEELPELLNSIAAPISPERECQLLKRLESDWANGKEDALVRSTFRTWRWVAVRRGVRRCAIGFAALILTLFVVGATLAWMARQGYLTAWFIRRGNRQLAKEMPELLEPARPLPREKGATTRPPTSSLELYSLTNIWPATLRVSAEQWKHIEPSHVQTVPLFQEGHMVLRNPNARRSGLAGVIGLDFNWVEAQLDFAEQSFAKVALRYRGNGSFVNSLYGPKQSFKVDLNKFAGNQRLGGVRSLNFVNAIPDNSYLHDALGEKLFRDLGVPGPRTAFAYLTLDVPGKFALQPLGLYVMIENIDSDFAKDRFGTKNVPIFKPVTSDLFHDLGDKWKAYAATYDLKTHATAAQLQRLVEFAQFVTKSRDSEFAQRLGEFLDLEEFAAFVAGHVLLASYDGFLSNGQNFYVYLDPRSNKFGFIPWDQDHAWGEFGYIATADKREQASIWKPSAYDDRFLGRVFKVEQFRTIYRRQLENAVKVLFTSERLDREIDALAVLIRPAVAAESEFRVRRFDLAVSTNWVSGPRDGQPEGPKAPVHQMKRFIINRSKSVRDQLEGRVEGEVLASSRGR